MTGVPHRVNRLSIANAEAIAENVNSISTNAVAIADNTDAIQSKLNTPPPTTEQILPDYTGYLLAANNASGTTTNIKYGQFTNANDLEYNASQGGLILILMAEGVTQAMIDANTTYNLAIYGRALSGSPTVYGYNGCYTFWTIHKIA